MCRRSLRSKVRRQKAEGRSDVAATSAFCLLPSNRADGAPRVSRLKSLFKRLRRDRRLGLIAYVTCGDGPTTDIILALAEAGADAIELGVPFSDPIADGPV